jgi:hypothetical protein
MRKARLSSNIYGMIADIIRGIDDAQARKIAADHFATELHRRSPSFDAYLWEKRTGGVVDVSKIKKKKPQVRHQQRQEPSLPSFSCLEDK